MTDTQELGVDSKAFLRAPITSGGFFLGGNAVFTVTVPLEFQRQHADVKDHYTFKIRFKPAEGRFKDTWFVSLLTGPDNTSSYSYMGMLDISTAKITITRKSCCGESAWSKLILERVLACAFTNQLEKIEAAGWLLMHEGRCCRCGRRLTVPESITAGIGPECAGKM